MAGTSSKLAVVALDGCDVALVRALASDGRCPHLARLLDEGAVVEIVRNDLLAPADWATLATGASVGAHRGWGAPLVDTESYELTPGSDAQLTPFWDAIERAGRRVALLDVPSVSLHERTAGARVFGWGCRTSGGARWSAPTSLWDELEAVAGPHPVGAAAIHHDVRGSSLCDHLHRTNPRRNRLDEQRLLRDLLRGTQVTTAASLALLDQGPWDLFSVVYSEGRCAGEQLWHVHDVGHPQHDTAARTLLGDPLVEVYRALDASLGAHLAALPDDATLWLLLPRGIGARRGADPLLDEVLRRLDPRLEAHRGSAATALAGRRLERLPPLLERVATSAIAAAVRWRSAGAPPPRSVPAGPSPARSFFALPSRAGVGAVRFNVIGRDAQGVVPAEALPALQARLSAQLRRVVSVDTGRPIIDAVLPADEVLGGPAPAGGPDLLVAWAGAAPPEAVWSPDIGTVAADLPPGPTGAPRGPGLAVVRGPGIQPGHRSQPLALVDVAPTVSAALGVELDSPEGAVRHDLLPGWSGSTAASGAPPPARGITPLAARSGPRWARRSAPSSDAALELSVETARTVAALEREVDELRHLLAVEASRSHERDARLEQAELERRVWTTMLWLDQEEIPEDQLISVITPTHRRPAELRRAIESVLAQRYTRWELVVVDDGDDAGRSVVAEVADDRIVYQQIPHGGVCAARNAGLATARGSIIAYLDDDNVLHPGWLRAVAWAFTHHPEHRVLYGARVIDDERRARDGVAGGLPSLHLERYDRSTVLARNIADIGVIAHRAGIPGAHFDEAFWECGDWDFFLSITQDQEPLMLPVVAFYYRTDSHDRLTGRFTHHTGLVRQKWARLADGAAGPPREAGSGTSTD